MCVDSPNYITSNYLLNVKAPKRQKVIKRMSHHSGSEPEKMSSRMSHNQYIHKGLMSHNGYQDSPISSPTL